MSTGQLTLNFPLNKSGDIHYYLSAPLIHIFGILKSLASILRTRTIDYGGLNTLQRTGIGAIEGGDS